jgi:hypothetical protein
MIVASLKTEAPVIKLTTNSYDNWIFQWVEFATTAALGTGAVLTGDDTS